MLIESRAEGEPGNGGNAMSNHGAAAEQHHYYARRERQERAAGERAVSDAARLIHLQLAERYAALARG